MFVAAHTPPNVLKLYIYILPLDLILKHLYIPLTTVMNTCFQYHWPPIGIQLAD